MPEMTLQQAMELAVQQHQAGQFAQAEQIYRQVLNHAPDHPDAMHLLGLLSLHTGRTDAALDLIGRAAAKHPQVADFQYNLGLAQLVAGQPEPAINSFRRAIEIQPKMAEAYANLAAALIATQRFDEAVAACRQSLAIQPNNPDTLNTLAVALKDRGRVDEAIEALNQALNLRPDFAEALTNLGNAYQNKKQLAKAIEIHHRAVAARPDMPEAHNNLGRALDDDYQYEQAIAEFRRALELRPDYSEAQCSLAGTLHRIGKFDEARHASEKAIAQWPDSPIPRFNLALMMLLQGRFEQGWALHEARWQVPELRLAQPEYDHPRWQGEDLRGKTLLIYAEQGYGDVIQFSRYAPLAAQRGATVILECQPELKRLMASLKGISQIITRPDAPFEYDFQCPIVSLPLGFKTTLETIPANVPYLHADHELVSRWRKQMPQQSDKIKIGLSWAGRPTHTNDRNRTIELATLAPFARVPNTWFCALQKGDALAQLKSLPEGFEVVDFSDDLTDFAETAALIENLDLVISIDTAAAHLAGALGKPVWVLLPFVPDWRWMLDRSDSPWYPTMRLFRQPRAKDWESVIRSVKDALNNFELK
ncbi:MAG TPA: tetratricopeptide repeat protein [Tepidisphaeraceae bacterium]|nr:tetratricopeptide repeat protein [Tepidisphaeraceae bacterium]